MGYDLERVEALLRERAHGLTRTPRVPARPHSDDSDEPQQPEPDEPVVRSSPTALLERTPPQAPRPEVWGGGACSACERPIGMPRVRAVPDAIRCIECQLAFESGLLPARA